jgi:hypothetical protein
MMPGFGERRHQLLLAVLGVASVGIVDQRDSHCVSQS